jgi:archaellum component FlaC
VQQVKKVHTDKDQVKKTANTVINQVNRVNELGKTFADKVLQVSTNKIEIKDFMARTDHSVQVMARQLTRDLAAVSKVHLEIKEFKQHVDNDGSNDRTRRQQGVPTS